MQHSDDPAVPPSNSTAIPPTHEPELTEPVDLCVADGSRLNPAARGWSRRPMHRANLRGRRFRTKKWDYWAVLAGDLAVGLVYADVGYLGLAGIWWGDLSTGRTGGRDLAVPLGGKFQLPAEPGTAPLVLDSKHLKMRLEDLSTSPVGPATRLRVSWDEPRSGKGGTTGPAEGELDVLVSMPAGHESLSVVIPWSETNFQFTTKDNVRPAAGTLEVGSQRWDIGADGDAWGVLDVGRGRWPYSTTWNWGAASGRATTGELIGVQFGAKWTEGTGFTENALNLDGRLHKIGRELTWDYDWDHPMRPWRVVDDGVGPDERALDLTLTPRLDKHGRTDAGVLRTEVHQMFGTWSGMVRDEHGATYQVDGIQGFAEESRNRW